MGKRGPNPKQQPEHPFTRIFRTSVDTPDKMLMERIGDLVCGLVQPFIFEINEMRHDGGLHYTLVCKITGKATDIGETWMKETAKHE